MQRSYCAVSLILLRSSSAHPASFGLGSEGSVGHTSPVVGTKGAAVFGLGTSGHADTHHQSGCAVRRGWGQAVTLHRGFAPIRDLAAPRHALRWPGVGGCGWSFPRVQCGQGVWRRVARSRPSVTVRGLLWGAYVAVFRRCTGALPSPCRAGLGASRAACVRPDGAPGRACAQGGLTSRSASATARSPCAW